MPEPQNKKYKIMAVDDKATNLTVIAEALEAEYEVYPVTSGKKALALLPAIKPALVLLDVHMPDMDGFETLARIRGAGGEFSRLPVIFLTAKTDSEAEFSGLRLGASDYIYKPFSIPVLKRRIKIHLDLEEKNAALLQFNERLSGTVREQTEIISELQFAVIHTLVDLIEYRDGVTGGHVTRTNKYLTVLIDGLEKSGCYRDEIAQINVRMVLDSAQLHDIGKVAIPDSILKKPAPLTREEFEEIKKHPLIGEQAIKKAMEMTRSHEFLEYAALIAVSHHERWDGAGYPNALRGEQIPLVGRLMAIADVYDALVSERPYKPAFPHEKAVELILKDSGTHFDAKLCEVFRRVSDGFLRIRAT